jgi:hypothetical protein
MAKNLLDLAAVQLHVKTGQEVPARGIEGAEPGMGIAVRRPEVRELGSASLDAVAGLLKLADDAVVGLGTGFDVGDAYLSRGNLAAPQKSDHLGNGQIHDTKVIERHENGPEAAAILHAAEPIDEHWTRSAFQIALTGQLQNCVPFFNDKRRRLRTRVVRRRSQPNPSLMTISSGHGSPAPAGASLGMFCAA